MAQPRHKLRYLDAVMIVFLLWLAVIICAALALRLRARHEL